MMAAIPTAAPVFGSLFSGCGGLDLGLERAGLVCGYQVEVEPHARAILERRWPDVRRHDDIRTFPPGSYEDWACDLLVGGDPCQENSRARVGARTRAPSLGAEFLRVVDALRPRLVLRENPTRARHDAPWPWWRFRDELERRGYAVLPFRLRSCCFGADHQRDRLFLLGEATDADRVPVRLPRRGPAAGATGGLQAPDEQRQRLRPDADPVGGRLWGRADPGDGRGDARLPGRVDRLRALSNAVDVRAAEWIGRALVAAARPRAGISPLPPWAVALVTEGRMDRGRPHG